jgi:hypothetical protein
VTTAGCGSSYGITLSYGSGTQFAAFPGCTPMEATFTQGGVPANAPVAQSLTVTAANGTAFLDGACTTPLGASFLVIAAGTSLVSFSYAPSAAGTCSVRVTTGALSSSLSSGC